MNAKLLFVSTVALALVSSLAMAAETGAISRAQVVADYNQAAASGTLRKTDYDFDAHAYGAASTQTRGAVLADMAAARKANKLVGPMRSGIYNPFGSDALRPSTLTRDEVKRSVVAAMQDGTLRHSDYDGVPATVARRAIRRASAAPVLAVATQGSAS